MSEMTAGDYALMANGGNGWNNMWNNPFMYLVWLALFRGNGCSGGLFGGDGNCNNGQAEAQVLGAINAQGMQTRQDIANGFNFQDNMNALRENYAGIRNTQETVQGVGYNLANKMCEETNHLVREVAAGDINIKDAINCNANGIMRELCQGFNCVDKGIGEASYRQQLANCEIERNLDSIKFENANNTCKITSAIHEEGEQTRSLINANEMQKLRTDLQSAQLALSNSQQTQTILNSLGRFVAYTGCGSNCPNQGCGSSFSYQLPQNSPYGFPAVPNYGW